MSKTVQCWEEFGCHNSETCELRGTCEGEVRSGYALLIEQPPYDGHAAEVWGIWEGDDKHARALADLILADLKWLGPVTWWESADNDGHIHGDPAPDRKGRALVWLQPVGIHVQQRADP